MRRVWTMLICLSLTALVFGAPPALAAAPAGADHGEPQLISGPSAGLVTAVTTLVIFALLLALLGRFAWGPIVTGLKAREDKIRGDIADAEEARRKAEATLKDYTQQLAAAEDRVRELLAKATADGEQLATNIRMKAQQEAEEVKERAHKDIDTAKNAAIVEIYDHAANLAVTGAEKILRRNLNADDQRDLLRRGLDELQTIKA